MIFQDEFFEFPSKYFEESEFVLWLQKLTGFRKLNYESGKKKIEILICTDSGDLELRYLYKRTPIKKVSFQIGALFIFNVSLSHEVNCSVKDLCKKHYYQKGVESETG